jgi:hypothetical protein
MGRRKSKVLYKVADCGLNAGASYKESHRFLDEPFMDDDIMSF